MNNKILELIALFNCYIKDFLENKIVIVEKPDGDILWNFDEL